MSEKFLFLFKPLFLALSLVVLALSAACTSVQTESKPELTCANFDWYETGRTDGALGLAASKLSEYQERCNTSRYPVNAELYLNGRDAGLIDYCTPTSGLEAGRSGFPYGGVCPSHLEPAFLAKYEIGRRVRTLQLETMDLEARIENMVQLLVPGQSSGGALRSQIDLLRQRRAQIDHEITKLETESGSF